MKNLYFKIRKAEKKDCPSIHNYIRSLAIYEKAEKKLRISVENLERDGFSDNPLFKALILEENDKAIGFALYYYRYSTWNGKSLYLEDLFIDPSYRGKGYGLQVMLHLAKLAIDDNCGRFEWQVLDWNEPAISFYKQIGAELDPEWVNCKMHRKELNDFLSNNQ